MSESKGMGRHDFMMGAAAGVASVSLPADLQGTTAPQEIENQTEAPKWVEAGAPNTLARYLKIGQPVALSGKRMVFTSYEYIMPGAPAWYDDAGDNVSVTGTADLWQARLRAPDAPTGIRIAVQPARHSPSPYQIERTKPWEHDGVSLAGNIIADDEDGYFKVWGTCSSHGKSFRCYLQSKDLQNWERPDLGLVDFAGNKHNNLVQIKGEAMLGYVFKDPSSREERWKWINAGDVTLPVLESYRQARPLDYDPRAMRLDRHNNSTLGYHILAVRGGVSPDGFRWTTIPEPLTVEHSDTAHTAYYDADSGRYVAYFRQWAMPAYSPQSPGNDYGLSWKAGRRSIGRAETDNFRKFPLAEIVLEPSPDVLGPSDTLYTNCHTFIPGTKDQHLFFPTIWHQDRDNTSVGVVASRDGKILHWLPGNPVLNTSPFGEWDGGAIFALPDLMEIPGGDWVLPYMGYNVPHKYPRHGAYKHGIGFATWPKGRLVGVQASERAQFMTYAFMPPGRKIRLNVLTTRGGGSAVVEVAGLSRKAVPGRSFDDCNPIVGDQRNALVTWKNGSDLGTAEGQPVALRFRMDHAMLFYVDFEG